MREFSRTNVSKITAQMAKNIKATVIGVIKLRLKLKKYNNNRNHIDIK